MRKSQKFNLLLLAPTTAPIFLLGIMNNSMLVTITGFLLLAIFGVGGLMQISGRSK